MRNINLAKQNRMNLFLLILFLLIGTSSCNSTDKKKLALNQPFENYRSWITQAVNDDDINGLAIALFDGDKIIWSDAFGYLNGNEEKEVDPETLFSIQSMSKTITATAVMIAAQKGLIDLDQPITEYLPEFTVNSCFEKDPQNKITMRHLLSHTAGFTHEAPVGNNYDASFPSYEAHIKSISYTWLKFPVGSKYSYSNIGIDLAAYILERVSKIPFAEFLEEELFLPLGINAATINPDKILANKNRAIGHTNGLKTIPAIMPFYGSGAVYTNLNDLVKFVRLHINLGTANNKQLLKAEYLFDMYKPVIVNYHDYALGIAFSKEENSYAYTHSGGGFGFGSTMKWYPEYKIGIVVLTNSDYVNSIYTTASRIAEDYIKQNKIVRDSTRAGVNPVVYYERLKSQKQSVEPEVKCAGDSVFKPSWNKYTGTYSLKTGSGFEFTWYAKIARFFGFAKQKIKVYEYNNCLYLKNDTEEKLIEYEPGLFFTPQGEALDFRKSIYTFRNIELD